MKHYLIFISFLFATQTAIAQTAVNQSKNDGKVISFEIHLSEGAILFTKTFRKETQTDLYYQAHYTLRNPLYNDGNPTEVRLTRESFESYFRTTVLLSASWKRISDYATAKNLSYSNEADWAVLINYYNQNCVIL
jgi:hypothetical protein